MFQWRPLRFVFAVALIVISVVVFWLQRDLSAPTGPLFFASPSIPAGSKSLLLTLLTQLGAGAEKLKVRAGDGKERDVFRVTREDVRARAAEFLRLEVVEQSPLQVASAIAALRRDKSNAEADPDSSWRPLLLIGKVLSLRAEAIMISEGPDAAWRQVQQGFDYAEALYHSAGSFPQVATARSIQGFFARTVSTAIAAREWPPAVLDEIAKRSDNLQIGPELLRSIEHEYTFARTMAETESAASPALVRPIVYQPNRTERLWSSTLGQALRALSENKYVDAYRLATSTPPVREQVPILWRNWLGYKYSVPRIQSCIDTTALIANAELQLQLVRLAANMSRHHAELGKFPQSLEMLVKRFPETHIRDPWLAGNAVLQYNARAGFVYSVGANRANEHVSIERSFDTPHTSDDYGVRLVP